MRTAKEIACEIRKTKWEDEELCRELCEMARLEEEWDNVFDIDYVMGYKPRSGLSGVLQKAADRLGVCVECVAPERNYSSTYRNAEVIAEDMRALDYWDTDLCMELIFEAGMEDEYEEWEAEEEYQKCDFSELVEKAAEKLEVDIY